MMNMHNTQKHTCSANRQNTLVINGGLKIQDWKDGDLGITLQEKDIDKVKWKVKTVKTIPFPIVLDLNGDGVTTTAVGTGAHFDHEADGFAESTGWVNSQDGLLVRDLNADGKINSGRELFGSETLLSNGKKAANGFEALRELDSNADGKISSADAIYATLRIWKDANGNGVTDAGELQTLSEAGVQSISVSYVTSATTDGQGNQHLQQGSYTTTGQLRSADDVWFKVDRTYSTLTDVVSVSEKRSKRTCAIKSIAARAYPTCAKHKNQQKEETNFFQPI